MAVTRINKNSNMVRKNKITGIDGNETKSVDFTPISDSIQMHKRSSINISDDLEDRVATAGIKNQIWLVKILSPTKMEMNPSLMPLLSFYPNTKKEYCKYQ